MKNLLLLLVTVTLTSCSQVRPVNNPSGADYSASHDLQGERSPGRKSLDTAEVDQRAKSYEQNGHPPEEARALAQIEYLKSGK